MSARDRVLGRVRAALARTGDAPQEALARVEAHLAARATGPRAPWNETPLERFRARAQALGSTLDSIPTPADAPNAVLRYLLKQRLHTGGVCWPTLHELPWLAAGLGMEARAARADDLVGVTECFCAIADTGTLVLLSAPETPAATSLLPETHIALVAAKRIVPYMEDAWRLVRQERGTLPRALNLVSGPSRTADIEQTVTLGAHGPYRVHILIVGE